MQMNAFVVLSDSGTLSEESSILRFPGVLIRTSTERPEVLDKGTLIIGGIVGREIIQAVELSIAMRTNEKESIVAADYKDDNVSDKVVKIIQSYVSVVNRCIWGKV